VYALNPLVMAWLQAMDYETVFEHELHEAASEGGLIWLQVRGCHVAACLSRMCSGRRFVCHRFRACRVPANCHVCLLSMHVIALPCVCVCSCACERER
jgi:hypothetical protein